jgi:farnesyl diphosphate synthase
MWFAVAKSVNEDPRISMDKSTESSPSSRRAALSVAMTDAARDAEAALGELLPKPHGLHERVHEAMRYATFAGGKRLRPFLVLHSARLFGVPDARARRVAAAIEAVHTYSLVHDDLPCMDDDDLRRGRPTTHRAFDEATAVLAGDALLTIAFEILADPATHESGEVRCRLIAGLAQAAGSNGMIGGQMIDMQAPTKAFSADDVIHLQRLKTGALFEYACEAGGILAEVGADQQNRLRQYARDLGLAFQIADDLLDVTGTTEQLGKTAGKDVEQGKATLVSVYGVDGARAEANKLAASAAAQLEVFGETAGILRELPYFIVERES